MNLVLKFVLDEAEEEEEEEDDEGKWGRCEKAATSSSSSVFSSYSWAMSVNESKRSCAVLNELSFLAAAIKGCTAKILDDEKNALTFLFLNRFWSSFF
jgi:hypothetical protein